MIGGWRFALPKLFETIEEWLLRRQYFLPGDGNSKPGGAIDFGKANGAPASWRPLDLDLVAADAVDIQIALQRKGVNQLSTTLANLAERLERAGRVETEFLGKLPARRGFGVLTRGQLPLRNRPRAKVALTPKRAAGVDKQNNDAGLAVAIHQDAGARDGHAIDLEVMTPQFPRRASVDAD